MFARPKTYITGINPGSTFDLEDIGEAAKSLSEIVAGSAQIPDTFVITSTAFDDFITAANIVDQIGESLNSLDPEEEGDLERVSAEISKLILAASIPSILLNPITHAYHNLSGLTDKYVYVSPSWVLDTETIPDDLGDYKSMNLIGEGALLYAIKKAWTSLFSPAALLRRRQIDYQGGLSIAIVVQKLIQGEVSGITFSADPVNLDEQTIQTEALLGLLPREDLNLHPDIYRVDRKTFEITEKHILEQDYMLIRKGRIQSGENPIMSVKLSSEWKRKQKLSDDAITSISKTAAALSNHFDHPVEIHWVVDTSKVYITALYEQTKLDISSMDYSTIDLDDEQEIEIVTPETVQKDKKSVDIETLAKEIVEIAGEVGQVDIASTEVANLEAEIAADVERADLEKPQLKELPPIEHLAEKQPSEEMEEQEELEPEDAKDEEEELDTTKLEESLQEFAEDLDEEHQEQDLEQEIDLDTGESDLDEKAHQPDLQPEQAVNLVKLTKKIKSTYDLSTEIAIDISMLESKILSKASKFDGGYVDGTKIILDKGMLPEALAGEKDKLRKLIENYAIDISTAAKAVNPAPLYYSLSDIGDKERELLEGEVSNEQGLDGSERFVLKPEALISEIIAVKRAKTIYGSNNIKLILPKLRTQLEMVEMKKIMNSQNFNRTSVLHFYAEISTPSFLYELEHTEPADLDGIIVNIPKLAQGMTGRTEFLSRDYKPLLTAIGYMIKKNSSHKHRFIIKLNDNPELVRAIFEYGINPEVFVFTEIPSEESILTIAELEIKQLDKPKKRGRTPKSLT